MYWRSLLMLALITPLYTFSDTPTEFSVGQPTNEAEISDSGPNLYDRQREKLTNPQNTTRSPYSTSSYYSSPYNSGDQSSYYYYNPKPSKPGTSDNSQYYYQWDNYQNPR